MIVELTPQQRHDAEAALPPIFPTTAQRASGQWPDTFYTDRIDWYTRLVIESDYVRGGPAVIPEFIAAMIGESALNNRAFGDQNPDIHFGVGWMQFDTEYNVFSLENLLAIRLDPLHALRYATNPANGLCTQGGAATHFKEQLWHAWEKDNIDPPLDDVGKPTGWSALGAAIAAWERVTA